MQLVRWAPFLNSRPDLLASVHSLRLVAPPSWKVMDNRSLRCNITVRRGGVKMIGRGIACWGNCLALEMRFGGPSISGTLSQKKGVSGGWRAPTFWGRPSPDEPLCPAKHSVRQIPGPSTNYFAAQSTFSDKFPGRGKCLALTGIPGPSGTILAIDPCGPCHFDSLAKCGFFAVCNTAGLLPK